MKIWEKLKSIVNIPALKTFIWPELENVFWTFFTWPSEMVVLMKHYFHVFYLNIITLKCEITEAETGSYAVEFIRISPPLFRFDSFLMELFTI